MSEYQVKVLGSKKIGQNIYKLLIEKPRGYVFIPGQFTEVTIKDVDKENYRRHFSFIGLNNNDYLEFIIKPCNSNDTVAKKIISLNKNEKLIITGAKGNLHYKGMGTFIAGGTGITPFIAIFRDLKIKNDIAGNMLIYSAKTTEDIIMHDELLEILGMNYINLFTQKRDKNYYFGRIDRNFLRMEIVDFVRNFYVSGSVEFVRSINSILKDFGVTEDLIICEQINISDFISNRKKSKVPSTFQMI